MANMSKTAIEVKNLRIEGLNAEDIDYVISFKGLQNITLDSVDMDGHANSPGTNKVTLLGIFRIKDKIILRNCFPYCSTSSEEYKNE